MAFLVKPVNGTEQKMELAQIHEALANGAIAVNWLVRDERQEHWYSVGKLVGKTTSQPVELFCPRCKTPIPAKMIDIGLPMKCPACSMEVIVPDPLAKERRLRDADLMASARTQAILGGVALGAGLFITLTSYFLRDESSGIWVFWWGPMAIGLGIFLGCYPRYLSLLKRLEKPVKAKAPGDPEK